MIDVGRVNDENFVDEKQYSPITLIVSGITSVPSSFEQFAKANEPIDVNDLENMIDVMFVPRNAWLPIDVILGSSSSAPVNPEYARNPSGIVVIDSGSSYDVYPVYSKHRCPMTLIEPGIVSFPVRFAQCENALLPIVVSEGENLIDVICHKISLQKLI